MAPDDSSRDRKPTASDGSADDADGEGTADQDDPPTDPAAGNGKETTAGEDARDGDGDGSQGHGESRDVVVPMRVYKAVTVFTTLFAVGTVVGGFVLLDSATNRATASLAEVDTLAALAGIGLIVAGAAAYAFSTRFRAAGMGKSKDGTDEHSDNG